MKSITIKNNIYVARYGGADISKFIFSENNNGTYYYNKEIIINSNE